MSDSLVLASIMIAALVILLPLLFHLTKYLGAQSDNVRKNEVVEGVYAMCIKTLLRVLI